MTYNEWRDELKSNLLCVSENERRRVLDYYAEAYADRRDAGFSEREIIEDFGAPYDAAQRILYENRENFAENYYENHESQTYSGVNDKKSERERRREEREARRENERIRREESSRHSRESSTQGGYDYYQSPPPAQPKPEKQREDYTWVFVLLCIVFCIPLFSLVMAMVGITISFCVAPFGILIAGVTVLVGGIAALFTGNAAAGACSIGISLIIIGVSIILIPLFIKLVKLMWQLFTKFFKWVRSLFSGKEKA